MCDFIHINLNCKLLIGVVNNLAIFIAHFLMEMDYQPVDYNLQCIILQFHYSEIREIIDRLLFI